MKNLIILLAVFLLLSCENKILLNDLIEKNSLYYQVNSANPYSGNTYSIDKTLHGDTFVSTSYTFKNGVPNGNWRSYGYQHEILQEGVFIPVEDISDLKSSITSLDRINICKYTEGSVNEVIDIFLITNKIKLDSSNAYQKEKYIVDFLRTKKYLNSEEKVDSCYWVSGEF